MKKLLVLFLMFAASAVHAMDLPANLQHITRVKESVVLVLNIVSDALSQSA